MPQILVLAQISGEVTPRSGSNFAGHHHIIPCIVFELMPQTVWCLCRAFPRPSMRSLTTCLRSVRHCSSLPLKPNRCLHPFHILQMQCATMCRGAGLVSDYLERALRFLYGQPQDTRLLFICLCWICEGYLRIHMRSYADEVASGTHCCERNSKSRRRTPPAPSTPPSALWNSTLQAHALAMEAFSH